MPGAVAAEQSGQVAGTLAVRGSGQLSADHLAVIAASNVAKHTKRSCRVLAMREASEREREQIGRAHV